MNVIEIKNGFSVSEVVRRYIELRPKGPEFWGCCPFHGETTSSFQVQDSRRSWHCYGCGQHGDVIDFVMKIEDCTIGRACDYIGGESRSDGKKFVPKELPPIVDPYEGMIAVDPEEKELPRENDWLKVWNPKPTNNHPDGRYINYKIALVHPYRDRDGKLYGCTARINLPDRKIVPMLRMIVKNGQRAWSHMPFDNPRPLYGCETITDLSKIVLIVEGEKCADIARRVVGGIVVTWSGGSNATKFADWSPLRDHNVLLWPDADQSGVDAMLGKLGQMKKWEPGIKEYAETAGAAKVINLGWDKSKPKGWDVADAIQKDGWNRDQIISWIKARIDIANAEVVI